MKHATDIKYSGGLEKLAEDLGNLRYDALEKFLNLLSEKLVNDSDADRGRKRTKLAKRLNKASTLVLYAANEIKEAWKISAPYMKFWVIASVSPDKYVTGYYVDQGEKGREYLGKKSRRGDSIYQGGSGGKIQSVADQLWSWQLLVDLPQQPSCAKRGTSR
jgi:hypothetical protein